MSKVAHVKTSAFDAEVLQSPIPVLVDFYATWCGPCQAMAPALEEIARDLDGKLKVVKVDIDEAEDLTEKFGILSVPTLIIFKKGAETFRKVGAGPKRQMLTEIKGAL